MKKIILAITVATAVLCSVVTIVSTDYQQEAMNKAEFVSA